MIVYGKEAGAGRSFVYGFSPYLLLQKREQEHLKR
jgi:hypothetical protein